MNRYENIPNAWKIMKFSEWNFWIFLISVGIEGWFNLIMNADRLKAGPFLPKTAHTPFHQSFNRTNKTWKNYQKNPTGKIGIFFLSDKISVVMKSVFLRQIAFSRRNTAENPRFSSKMHIFQTKLTQISSKLTVLNEIRNCIWPILPSGDLRIFQNKYENVFQVLF